MNTTILNIQKRQIYLNIKKQNDEIEETGGTSVFMMMLMLIIMFFVAFASFEDGILSFWGRGN